MVPLRYLFEGLLDLIYPPRCLACGDRVFVASSPLCLSCYRRADLVQPAEVRERLDGLTGEAEAIDFAFSLWLFDKGGSLQRVHQALKYGNRPRVGRVIGQVIGRAYAQLSSWTPHLIVPVPLHRLRLYERGYNQSEMLALGISHVLGAPVKTQVIRRVRSTRSQTSLSREARWENLRDAFEPGHDVELFGARALLVDDILTTGATAVAAAEALLSCGAGAVDLATMAMARA